MPYISDICLKFGGTCSQLFTNDGIPVTMDSTYKGGGVTCVKLIFDFTCTKKQCFKAICVHRNRKLVCLHANLFSRVLARLRTIFMSLRTD